MSSAGTVLITGGSRGIGAETARLLVAAGHDVCFTYESREDAAAALVCEIEQSGHRGFSIRANGADPKSAARVLQALPSSFAPLTGLVNNAGITKLLGSFAETSHDTLRQVMDVNVLGPMYLTQAVVSKWRAAQRIGAVVNVSSIAASLGAAGEYVPYGLQGGAGDLPIGLAKELAEEGIRADAVSPGTALTELHAAAGEPGRPQRVAARIPMRRPAEAREIAEAIVWLLSDKSSYVTGSVLKLARGS